MLTIRSFRNEDPPKLLEIWQKNRRAPARAHFLPLTISGLDTGPLAMPFFDSRRLLLALDGDRPVGFVHVGFGSNADGSDLSYEVGHIAMVAVVPDYPEPVALCKELIKAGEDVLIEDGAHEIYGGSPRPSLPYYLGLYGVAEPLAVFDADAPVAEAYRLLGYGVRQKTVRFQRELANYTPPMLPNMLQWKEKVECKNEEFPHAKSWWDALSLAQFAWIETTAFLLESNVPVAQVRICLAEPFCDVKDEASQRLYDNRLDSALMNVIVAPQYLRQGLGGYVLREALRYLISLERVSRIETHISEDFSSLFGLLKALKWSEVETGTIFSKEVIEV